MISAWMTFYESAYDLPRFNYDALHILVIKLGIDSFKLYHAFVGLVKTIWYVCLLNKTGIHTNRLWVGYANTINNTNPWMYLLDIKRHQCTGVWNVHIVSRQIRSTSSWRYLTKTVRFLDNIVYGLFLGLCRTITQCPIKENKEHD